MDRFIPNKEGGTWGKKKMDNLNASYRAFKGALLFQWICFLPSEATPFGAGTK